MRMDHETFITTIAEEAQVSREEADRAARVTLTTLAERLTAGEARDIGKQLPEELRPCMETEGKAEPFHLDEFVRRVADRAGVEPATAERQVRAVFTALAESLSAEEFHDMASELPKDFAPVLREAEQRLGIRKQPVRDDVLPYDDFVAAVMRRAGADRGDAEDATSAVLEILAERISGGQVEDLELELAVELHPPLERGNGRTDGAATPLSLEEFLQGVAALEDTTPQSARDHARAVFATLREAVTEDEFSDMTAQLPREYRRVLAPP